MAITEPMQENLTRIVKIEGNRYERTVIRKGREIVTGNEKIFMLDVTMSSANKIERTTQISSKKSETEYRWEKETRDAINATRARHKLYVYRNTMKFGKNYLIKEKFRRDFVRFTRLDVREPEIVEKEDNTEINVNFIIDHVELAEKELQAIEPHLYADLNLFELAEGSIRQGEMYGKILAAIRFQVNGTVMKRLSELLEKNSELPQKTITSLVSMIDQLKTVNILNDKEIDARLEYIKTAIVNKQLAPIVADLEAEMKLLDVAGRFRFIDTGEDNAPGDGQENEKEEKIKHIQEIPGRFGFINVDSEDPTGSREPGSV